jgi:tetratricopeptide (TPR) repeat protein
MNPVRTLSALVLLAASIASYGCALRADRRVDGSFKQSASQARDRDGRAPLTFAAGAVAATVEAQDPILAAALAELALFPTPARHRQAAERFRTLKILDTAYDHFARARTLDPTDAGAYEGLAQIWRDWGFPNLGLGDASRSVYYAPSRASAHNTLGTILSALGQRTEARRAYERAAALDPAAAYVRNNLCYLSFLEGQLEQAVAECRAALNLDPAMAAARNNLALAYFASSRDDLALHEFLAAGGNAAGLYNIGIVQLAERRYGAAARAFEAAQRLRPSWTTARDRARETRALAAAQGELAE